jgi:hypothetical protein
MVKSMDINKVGDERCSIGFIGLPPQSMKGANSCSVENGPLHQDYYPLLYNDLETSMRLDKLSPKRPQNAIPMHENIWIVNCLEYHHLPTTTRFVDFIFTCLQRKEH